MTRRKAIKEYYRWLHGGNLSSVRNCTMYGHPLYPYRSGRIRDDKPEDGRREPDVRTGADYRFDKPMQAAKAIRATCLDCAETSADVRECQHTGCPLWMYRMGRKDGIPETTTKPVDTSINVPESHPKNAQIGLVYDDESTDKGTER